MGLLLILAVLAVWHGLARVFNSMIEGSWLFYDVSSRVICHLIVFYIALIIWMFGVVLWVCGIHWPSIWHWLVYMR